MTTPMTSPSAAWTWLVHTVAGVDYDPASEVARQATVARILTIGSAAITGGAVAALFFKYRYHKSLLPKALAEPIERAVCRVEAATEPANATRIPAQLPAYITQCYGTIGLSIGMNVLGSLAFIQAPDVCPVIISVMASFVPTAAVVYFPKTWFSSDKTRMGLVLFSSFAQGYMLGPINYILQDLMGGIAVCAFSTCAGFVLSSFLTRGSISFFMSALTLSSSMSVLALQTTDMMDTRNMDAINTVLFGQMLANAGLCVLHSLPRLLYFKKLDGSADKEFDDVHSSPTQTSARMLPGLLPFLTMLPAEPDWIKEAKLIHSAGLYATWAAVRYVVVIALQKLTKQNSVIPAGRQHDRKNAEEFLQAYRSAQRVSDGVAAIIFLLAYIRFVSYLQRGSSRAKLEAYRKLMLRLNPLRLLM